MKTFINTIRKLLTVENEVFCREWPSVAFRAEEFALPGGNAGNGTEAHSLQKRIPAHRRRASILVCVLVCVMVATALVGATVRCALQAHKEVRTQRYLRQTELLLEAGVQRAAQRLAANEDYTGETWTLSPASVPGATSAQVEIKVPSLDDGEWPRRVEVVARISTGGPNVIQRSYSYPLNDLAQSDQE